MTARWEKWKWPAAYAGFGLFAFALGLYLTFPYDALKARLLTEASNNGLYVRIKSLGPGFFGVTADGVQVSRKMEANEDKAPPALKIDSVALRPSLFPLGVSVRARLLHGTATAAFGVLGDLKVRASLDELNLQDEDLHQVTGLALSGKASGSLSLNVPMTSATKSAPAEPDLSKAQGSLSLDTSQLVVNSGTLTIPLPMYGNQPTPIDLPKVALGDLEGKVKFDKGTGTIDTFHTKSDDLELIATGTLKLAKRLDFSDLNLGLKLKASQDFQKRVGLLSMGLSALEADKENPDFRQAHLTGMLSRPNFR